MNVFETVGKYECEENKDNLLEEPDRYNTEIYRSQSYQTFFKLVNAYLSENRYLASQIYSLLSRGAENQKRL